MAQPYSDRHEQVSAKEVLEDHWQQPDLLAEIRRIVGEELDSRFRPSPPHIVADDEMIARVKESLRASRQRQQGYTFSVGYTPKVGLVMSDADIAAMVTNNLTKSDNATIPTSEPQRRLLNTPLAEVWKLITALAESDGGKDDDYDTCTFCQGEGDFFHTVACPIIKARAITGQLKAITLPRVGGKVERYIVRSVSLLHECPVDVPMWGRLDYMRPNPEKQTALLYAPLPPQEKWLGQAIADYGNSMCFFDGHNVYTVKFDRESP